MAAWAKPCYIMTPRGFITIKINFLLLKLVLLHVPVLPVVHVRLVRLVQVVHVKEMRHVWKTSQ